MKKFLINSILFCFIAVLISCNGLTGNKNTVSDENIYLRFSVNKDNARGVYNPTSLTEDTVDNIKLYCLNSDNQATIAEWSFDRTETKNAVQVFEDSVIEMKAGTKSTSPESWAKYDFIIELNSNDFKEVVNGVTYYTPIQSGRIVKVIVMPGWNDLHFETTQYRANGWQFRSLLKFDYKIKSNQGIGYFTAELRTWPYNNTVWAQNWSSKDLTDVGVGEYHECRYTSSVAGEYIKISGNEYIDDGNYRMVVNLYDHEGGTIIRQFSDTIYLFGYKTDINKELSLKDFDDAGNVILPSDLLQSVSIGESDFLCKDHGDIEIINDFESNAVTYDAELYYQGQLIAQSKGSSAKLSVASDHVTWNNDIFTNLTPVDGEYVCQLLVKSTYQGVTGGQSFSIVVPERQYVSYSINPDDDDYLDPAQPSAQVQALAGNYLIHLYGEGTNTVESEGTTTYGTISKYVQMLRNLNENASIFLDFTDVTNVTATKGREVDLERVEATSTPGALLSGIAFPESLETVDWGLFFCPSTELRTYAITVVFGSNVENIDMLVNAGEWDYDFVENPDYAIEYKNPFKKFVVRNNPYLKLYENGALLTKSNPDGWTQLISAVDKIVDLKMPANILKISESAFAGCKKLKSVSDWADVREICFNAFRYSGLTGDIVLGEDVILVQKQAFDNTSITSLTLPESIKLIYCNIIPSTAYIGYKPNSAISHKWNWIDEATLSSSNLYDWQLTGCLYNEQPYPTPKGTVDIDSWKKNYNFYKYQSYHEMQGFNELYLWLKN